jgi:hypothetical protein
MSSFHKSFSLAPAAPLSSFSLFSDTQSLRFMAGSGHSHDIGIKEVNFYHQQTSSKFRHLTPLRLFQRNPLSEKPDGFM